MSPTRKERIEALGGAIVCAAGAVAMTVLAGDAMTLEAVVFLAGVVGAVVLATAAFVLSLIVVADDDEIERSLAQRKIAPPPGAESEDR